MSSGAAHALERAAATSLTADALYEVLPGHLKRLVGCGPVFIAAVDPTTMHFVRDVRSDIPDAIAAEFMRHEIGVPDVVKFRKLAVAARPVDSLFRATDGALPHSARWRNVIEPIGWGDELRVAIRDGRQTWGVLCMHRSATDAPFDDGAFTAVQNIVQPLASALRRIALADTDHARGSGLEPGVVVLDEELVMRSMTEAAAAWLDMLGASGGELPIVLMSAAVQAISSGRPQSVSVITSERRWVTISASALHGPGPDAVALVLQPAHPTEILPALAAAAQLTPRETQVLRAALAGRSDRAIARSLGISEYTVQDHLKRVYAKTSTTGRAELVARLLLPSLSAGSPADVDDGRSGVIMRHQRVSS